VKIILLQILYESFMSFLNYYFCTLCQSSWAPCRLYTRTRFFFYS